jgi:hypothetical protein
MAGDKKVISEKARDHYDAQAKGANYLLVAHAAGLIGCLSVLKDYATIPQLKGLGTFILIFGVGLLAAIANFVGISLSVMFAMNMRDDRNHRRRFWLAAVNITLIGFAGLIVSLVALVVGIITTMVRFSSL